MYEIEKGIPVAEIQMVDPKYPFEKMEVGDSFFVKHEGKGRNPVAAAIYYYEHKLGRDYTQRAVPGGLRVWRIK